MDYSNLQLIPFSAPHSDALISLMQAFNEEENLCISHAQIQSTLQNALNHGELVEIYLLLLQQQLVGYVTLAYGFSFEFGGVEAAIDEIYLLPDVRAKGLGSALLTLAQQQCSKRSTVVLRADIAHTKPGLEHFYEKSGFIQHDYSPFYKKLSA